MIFYKKFKFSESVLFISGLFLKILLGTFLSSDFLSDLFIPFVDYFVESGFSNPYDRFLNTGDKDYFPYPAFMLYIMCLPKLLFGWIFPENPFFNLFLYRLPLLLADTSIFLVLMKWLKSRSVKKIVYFYWLSPVLIYISYIHGQFDVIPVALLFVSLYFLFEDKLKSSAFLLGLSLAAKTNIALVYPFFFVFLVSRGLKSKRVALFFFVSLCSFFAVNIPYVFNSSFVEMVFHNREQGKLFSPVVQFGSLVIYVIPATLLVLFAKGVSLKNYNRDIFLMFLGFGFSVILLFVPPMPGWYFWIMPFLIYFYVKESQYSFLFFGLQASYILYFILLKNADYLEVFQFLLPDLAERGVVHDYLSGVGVNADVFSGLAMTVLQTTLLMNCFCIYGKGLRSYTQHKLTASPFLIGIGGDSGTGKTKISKALLSVFKPLNTTVLHGDDMHKWERGSEKWSEFTHLNPKANYLHREIDCLRKLKAGWEIYRRHYDHSKGKFTKNRVIRSNNLILFEGLHPFYLDTQSGLYDLKIFINPEIELVYHWKLVRDIKERGHSKRDVLESIRKRKFDSGKYVKTQMNKADILIEPLALGRIKNVGDREEQVEIYYRLFFSNNVYMEPVVEAFKKVGTLSVTHEYTESNYQLVTLKGNCSFKDIANVANDNIKGLEDMGLSLPHQLKDSFGVLIILITYYIFEKADSDRKHTDLY